MSDIHQIAQDFLDKLSRGEAYREERIETTAIEASNLVVLRKDSHPRYFSGFKNCGRPIFAHDVRLARSFVVTCPTLSEHAKKLKAAGLEVTPEPTIWREGQLV